jgi:hypothetical protein
MSNQLLGAGGVLLSAAALTVLVNGTIESVAESVAGSVFTGWTSGGSAEGTSAPAAASDVTPQPPGVSIAGRLGDTAAVDFSNVSSSAPGMPLTYVQAAESVFSQPIFQTISGLTTGQTGESGETGFGLFTAGSGSANLGVFSQTNLYGGTLDTSANATAMSMAMTTIPEQWQPDGQTLLPPFSPEALSFLPGTPSGETPANRFTESAPRVTPTSIPEPVSLALFGTGLLGLALILSKGAAHRQVPEASIC